MKNKILLGAMLCLACTVSLCLNAQDYSREQLSSLANTYFEVNSRTSQGENAIPITLDTLYLENKAKMFLCQDGTDWVVFANEQKVTPVVCHGKGHFTLEELQKSPLWLLLTESMIGLDSLRIRGNDAVIPARDDALMPTRSRSHPTPLLTIRGGNRWNQAYNNSAYTDEDGNLIYNHSNIYNLYTPTFYNCVDGRTWVGCTAVAMGQVMWYHQWPLYAAIPDTIDCAGMPSIILMPHFYYWNNIPGSILDTTPMSQVKDVAKLLRDCGYAGHMVYGPSGSSMTLTNAKNALTNTFQYNAKMRHYSSGATLFSNTIKSEIASSRPVIIQATHATDVINNGTHTFVIDGYDSATEEFHLNLGWGGKHNGWYSVSGGDAYYYYTIARRMLYEIIPNRSASTSMSTETKLTAVLENNTITLTSGNEDSVYWSIYDLYGKKVTSGTGWMANIATLPQGIYSFVAETPTATCQLKFMKE